MREFYILNSGSQPMPEITVIPVNISARPPRYALAFRGGKGAIAPQENATSRCQSSLQFLIVFIVGENGGAERIRTSDTVNPYNSLANCRLQPLGHRSVEYVPAGMLGLCHTMRVAPCRGTLFLRISVACVNTASTGYCIFFSEKLL